MARSVTALRRGLVVVDDNRLFREALGRLISRRGFVPHIYASFNDASAAIDLMTCAPDAAIVDVFLDGGRLGFDIARQIRGRFGLPLPISMMTGYSFDILDFERLAGEVSADILEKPLSLMHCNSFLVKAALSPLCLCRAVYEAVIGLCVHYDLLPQEARILGQLALLRHNSAPNSGSIPIG